MLQSKACSNETSNISQITLTDNKYPNHCSLSNTRREIQVENCNALSCNATLQICHDKNHNHKDLAQNYLNNSCDKVCEDQRALQHNSNRGFPLKNELHTVCFDEIVREISNEYPKQGLLLKRIRDELSTSCDTYKKLYESSVAFGIQKALDTRHEKEMLLCRIDVLNRERDELFNQVNDLKERAKRTGIEELIDREKEVSQYREELKKVKGQNERIQRSLESFLLNGQDEISSCVYGTDR